MGKIRDVCRKLETRVRGSNGGCVIGGIRVLPSLWEFFLQIPGLAWIFLMPLDPAQLI